MPKSSAKTSERSVPEPIPALSVKDCSVNLGGASVLSGVTFDIAQGEIAAIIGPNGSGKTTLLKTVLGLIPPSGGEIRIFGKHLHAVRTLIGYVPQRFDFDRDFPITVGEFMDLARHQHCPPSRIAEKIREVGLPARTIDARLGSLSGGQLQRVLIAQAILNNPAMLFLDEPSSGIDIAGEATFYELIEHLNVEHDTTILLVSHDIAMVAGMVDNVICVNKKMLCYGPPQDALTMRKIDELFGPQRLYDHPKHGDRHEHPDGETHDHGH
jgi:zinc transport system ATP-binding protein